MISDRLDELTDYPFPRLDALIADLEPPAGETPMLMWIGEPRHGVPEIARAPLASRFDDYGRYPPVEGTPGLRDAIAAWLGRRFKLPEGMIEPGRHILPVTGTREALFMVALVAVPSEKAGKRPAVLMPNPFYQPYKGGAVAAGAEPVYASCGPDTGFLPDLDALDPEILERTALFYLCTPANPQGAVASRAYLRRLVDLARRYDFTLASDECYTEIYDREPPPGVLEICAEDGDFSNVVAFHSLSKRSGVPGLRSGFVAGDPQFIKAFVRLRKYAAAGSPFAALDTAERLWRDEAHVEVNRQLYRDKIDIAERILGNRFGFFRPPGGFFLWLDVGDGERAARTLWSKAAVKVLPGAYLAADGPDGQNPAESFIRVALDNDVETTREALTRLADVL